MKNYSVDFWRLFTQPVSKFSILLAGIYSFMWGTWVFSPFWDAFSISPIYSVMDGTGSELGWGLVQMVVGVYLILSSLGQVKSIKWATFAGFMSWSLIAMSFAISTPLGPGMWVAGYIASTNAYFYLNTIMTDKISD